MRSRAQEAGRREVYKVRRFKGLWNCMDCFEEEMGAVVEGDGEEVNVRYWPRRFEKAKSWKMVKAGE